MSKSITYQDAGVSIDAANAKARNGVEQCRLF